MKYQARIKAAKAAQIAMESMGRAPIYDRLGVYTETFEYMFAWYSGFMIVD